ncbi:SCO1664 family protein [Nocardioides sp. B-3]|uniref:SCO1664 family protein n=1 Tax=Nocardioides sp. B-3 TaxID=2895565 RepID=UPI00300E2401
MWDFPDGTSAGREIAAYLVSEAPGWNIVPRTILRDGPHGPGMVRVWQEPDPTQAAVDLVPAGLTPEGFRHVFDGVDARDREVSLIHEDSIPLRLMAVFDVLVNNADRKGGHVLAMPDFHRYGVDHGLTFHVDHKLRTVLWGWLGSPLLEEEQSGVRRVQAVVDGALGEALSEHVTRAEISALARRCRALLAAGELPSPRDEYPVIPRPPF